MNTIILIILSLFATIGLAFIIDSIIKYILYDRSSVSHMEIILELEDGIGSPGDIIHIIAEATAKFTTKNGPCHITVIDQGLSLHKRKDIDNTALLYNNIKIIKGTKE